MKPIAFLTMDSMHGFFAYDHLALPYLASRGCQVDMVSWRKSDVCWNDYSMVVIRSPWDYQQDPRAFLQVLRQIEGSTAKLENDLNVVTWNLQKTYLRDLQERGVTIVPTTWLTGLTPERLQQLTDDSQSSSDGNGAGFVVKPVIGANADDTFRITAGCDNEILRQVATTFSDRELMLQPFIPSVVEIGEYSMFYFGGQYSHCILKTPARGDFRVQEEHGGTLETVAPEDDLLAAANLTIAAMNCQPLYARVDLVRLQDGRPALMELELIEPSLYLAHDPLAPSRFADAILSRL